MDGLTTAVTIGTVLDLSGKLLSASRRYYKEVKGAKKEIKSIIDEISNLQEVLKRIEQLGDSLSSSQLATLNPITKPDGPVHQCNSILEPLVSKLDKPVTSRRVLIWPLKKNDVDIALREIERLKLTLTLDLSTAQTALQLSSDTQLLSISDEAERQKNEKLRRDVIAWLSTTSPSSNHNINRRKHQSGTGKWFVNGSYFERWRKAPNSFVWLHGSAGCGKSVLSSTIIDHVQANHVVRTKSALVYYYFDFNDSMKQKTANFMSSIIADLCTQTDDLPDPVKQLYLKCNNGHREPFLNDLLCIFLAIVPLFVSVYVVIDALDECPTKDDERQELLKIIKAIHVQSAMNLHLLVTSRRHYDIQAVIGSLAGVAAIQIESTMNDDDIKTYIHSEVQEIRKNNTWWHDKLCIAVEEALSNGADGMFRWVYCQLDSLKSCLRATAVEEKLKKLPKDLRTTYAQIIAAIPEEHLEDARVALRWLVFSGVYCSEFAERGFFEGEQLSNAPTDELRIERPLSLLELVEALRVDPSRSPPVDTDARLANPTQILDILPNLISISGQVYERSTRPFGLRHWAYDRTWAEDALEIKLAHFSVKEFLLSRMTEKCEAAPLLTSIKLNQRFMTESCLYYILSYEESEKKARSEKDLFSFPLLRYACQYWPDHRSIFINHEQCNSQMEQQAIMESILLKLFTLSAERLAWLQVYRPDEEHMGLPNSSFQYGPPVTALYLAAYHGFYGIVNLLLDSGQDIEEEGGRYGTPLLVACYRQNLDVARLLLDHRANINAGLARKGGARALHQIMYNGSAKTMGFLLEHGASLEPKNHVQNNPFAHAILIANREVIETLLDHGANIELPGKSGYTPLMKAVKFRGSSVVNLLLDRGANINQISEHADLTSALHICAYYGYVGMATLLLDRGANIQLSGSKGLTPLAMAAQTPIYDMVNLLLNRGADVFARDQKGRTVQKLARRERRRMEKKGYRWAIEELDRIILRLKEAEKAWQEEHGIVVDQDATSGSDSGAEDTEGDSRMRSMMERVIQQRRENLMLME